jgi:hypothetical protein
MEGERRAEGACDVRRQCAKGTTDLDPQFSLSLLLPLLQI